MADATLGHMIFRHRSHTECTQQRGMHTRSASLLSCRLALSCRFTAPLEFARVQGRPVQPTMLVIPATTPVKMPILQHALANRHVHRAECHRVAMLDQPVSHHHGGRERAPAPIGAAPPLLTSCALGLPTLCAWSDGPRGCTAVQKLERCAVAANRARKVHEAHALTGARLAETIS